MGSSESESRASVRIGPRSRSEISLKMAAHITYWRPRMRTVSDRPVPRDAMAISNEVDEGANISDIEEKRMLLHP